MVFLVVVEPRVSIWKVPLSGDCDSSNECESRYTCRNLSDYDVTQVLVVFSFEMNHTSPTDRYVVDEDSFFRYGKYHHRFHVYFKIYVNQVVVDQIGNQKKS